MLTHWLYVFTYLSTAVSRLSNVNEWLILAGLKRDPVSTWMVSVYSIASRLQCWYVVAALHSLLAHSYITPISYTVLVLDDVNPSILSVQNIKSTFQILSCIQFLLHSPFNCSKAYKSFFSLWSLCPLWWRKWVKSLRERRSL